MASNNKKIVIDEFKIVPILITPNGSEYKEYYDWIINEIIKSFNIPYSVINKKDSNYNAKQNS